MSHVIRRLCFLFLVPVLCCCQKNRPQPLPVEEHWRNPSAYVVDSLQQVSLLTLSRVDSAGHLYRMSYKASYDLDGMLESGTKSLEDMMGFVGTRLLRDFPLSDFKIGSGCSSFTAFTHDKDVLFARNYDFRHDPLGVVIETAPENGYRSIGIADAAWFNFLPGSLDDSKTDVSLIMALPYATLDGVNEKGVCLSVMQLETKSTEQADKSKNDMVTTTAIRLALDHAASVDEVISLWNQHNMHSAVKGTDFHFLVADASGRTVVLEYLDGALKVLEDKTFVANELLSPGRDHPEKSHRYGIMKEALAMARDTLEMHDAMNILSLLRQGGHRRGAPTQWSAVYNLTRRTMEVAVNKDYEHVFSFSLND